MIFFRTSSSKRVVAFLLIALTCLCLGVEDLLVPDACEEDRSAPFAELRFSSSVTARDTQGTSRTDAGDDDHGCLCCCRHLVTSVSIQPSQILNSSMLDPIPGEVISSVDPQPPYHPPRS